MALVFRALGQAGRVSDPTFQRDTFGRGSISGARFAPDGKTIVYSATWEGRPAEVFAMQPGSPESRSVGLREAELLAVSPSSDLAVSLRRRFLLSFETSGMLARLPLNGGAPRELQDGVTDADWSPDGQQFAVTRPEAGQWRLEFPTGKVLATSPGWINLPRFSPDGRRLAYAEHPQRGDTLGRVAVVDLGGRRLYEGGIVSALTGLAWSPKGDEVWFTGDDVRALSPSGKVRVVLRAPGNVSICDASRDGRALLARPSRRREIMGLAPGESSEKNLTWHDWSYPSGLSADGRTLLFDEQQDAAAQTGGYLAYVRRTDGSPAVLLGRARSLSLSPDGRRVLALGLGEPAPLLVLPTGAGAPRTIPTKGISWQWGGWMPDGRRAVVQGSEGGRAARLYVVDTDTGERRVFGPEGASLRNGDLVSPDGKTVAAIGPDGHVVLCALDGGQARPAPGVEPEEVVIRWTADGRGLYVFRSSGVPVRVFRVDLATGRRDLWKEFSPPDPAGVYNIGPILLSADGKSYIYSYRRLLDDLYIVMGLQ